MIRLTNTSNKPVWIAPENIRGICENDYGTEIYVDEGQPFIVTESPEEVARKVLEWKLAMADYQSGEYRQMARQTLEELAGLHV